MNVERMEKLPLDSDDDIVRVRQRVREFAVSVGMSLVEQTKIVTAASEIARNTVRYGGGGEATIEAIEQGARKGVRLTFSDEGPGIADVQLAMTDGYTTGTGLGLGLSGAKRLSTEFSIASPPGEGTTVTLVRWK